MRQIREQRRHLALGLEVLLRGEETRPPLIGKDLAARDTDARFMRFEIVGGQELHRMRRHHGQPQLRSQRQHGLHITLELARAAASRGAGRREPLQLDVEAVWEEVRPTPRMLQSTAAIAHD